MGRIAEAVLLFFFPFFFTLLSGSATIKAETACRAVLHTDAGCYLTIERAVSYCRVKA